MSSYPIIAGYKLNAAELDLARLWLGSSTDSRLKVRELETVGPREFTKGLNFLPRASLDDMREILQWCRPMLILGGSKVDEDDMHAFFEMGAGAFLPMPAWDGAMLFPPVRLPEVQGSVFIVTDDSHARGLYRQMLRFAGYEIRVDFRSADEIARVLDHMHAGPHPGESETPAFPELILLDLDSARVDVPKFFHHLKSWTRENPRAKAALRIMVTRDFGKPGGDIAGMAGAMRPFVRRIFHPLEALPALMEAFLFHASERATGMVRLDSRRPAPAGEYRGLPELLHGTDARPAKRSPRELLEFTNAKSQSLRKSLPFLWLHDYLNTDAVREGAILAPQPDVDGGNLLHGVGSPHPAGKSVQHASE